MMEDIPNQEMERRLAEHFAEGVAAVARSRQPLVKHPLPIGR